MSSTDAWGPRTRGHGGLTGRVRNAVGMRGQRSHPNRPQPAHRTARTQPPPVV